MFTAPWYFPKLSAFFDSLQPLFLALFIPREVWAEVPLLLFSYLVQRGQLSKGQRDSGECLFRLLWSEGTNRETWDGAREDGHVQTGFLHTWDGCLFQICWSLGVTYWSAHRLTLSITSNHSERGCMGTSCRKVELESSCGWRNLSWPYLMSREYGPHVAACVCLKKLHYQALKEIEAETIGATQEHSSMS